MKLAALFPLCALLLVLPLRANAAAPATDTVIECMGDFETVSTDTEITSTFRDKVVVTGNNLTMTCDFLTVVAIRQKDTSVAIGDYKYFKSLVAVGHVRIVQNDREATCGRAEIFPGDDKIVLSEKSDGVLPQIRNLDDQSTATGFRIILYRGQRRAVIEPDPQSGVRMVGPALKDLGYDKNKSTPPPSSGSEPKIVAPVIPPK
jgi:lipopolysaccharide export system protein LptA